MGEQLPPTRSIGDPTQIPRLARFYLIEPAISLVEAFSENQLVKEARARRHSMVQSGSGNLRRTATSSRVNGTF